MEEPKIPDSSKIMIENPYDNEILDDEHPAEIIRKQEEEWIKNQETWAKE